MTVRSDAKAAAQRCAAALVGGLLVVLPGHADATPQRTAMLSAFAQTCFSPLLTAETAKARLSPSGARHDFYDLMPFSDVPRSPARTVVTPGTDRRCEVSFDGDAGDEAAEVAAAGLTAEGIRTDAPLPATHTDARIPGTSLLAARYLNPNRIAVVHTGTRPGPNGIETFLSVERLTPDASAEAAQ
ncbi:succinyl-CoA synthetase subunit beta [Jannaschia sp. 2305UL9-9]|uniref:succinyl-CoA synthetase subunit beta n=1 Tax=Jannaschia sp. 2305UL9-9 TaxID=3121638 RepID=UPI0035292A48